MSIDPTFPDLCQMRDQFVMRDIPVTVHLESGSYTFQTRVIESQQDSSGKKLRLILFSFYDHVDEKGDRWNPHTTDELSCAPLEVLRAFQQEITVHSMMTFSLGNFLLDGLKNIGHEDVAMIPQTLILNRGLSSIWKVASQLYSFPISYLLYQAVYSLGLDANPERELVDFFERVKEENPSSLEGRKVVIIEARNDRYFSGNGALDPDLREHLAATGIEAFQGSFFVPLVAEAAHHALRLDLLINNEDSGTVTSHFLSAEKNEALPTTIVRNLLMETDSQGFHTLFLAGGNKDMLDSITYLQAAPLMSAFLKQVDV